MDASAKSETGEQVIPTTRRIRTLAEKLRILAELGAPGASVAAVARQHGMNANLLFAWRRLHRKGLLETQRHAPALLPVKIDSPTITPTQRTGAVAKTVRKRRSSVVPTGGIELVLPGEIVLRLTGEAQRTLLDRILEWFPRR